LWERNNRGYNPWGKQGSGAPMRDPEGHIIANYSNFFMQDQEISPARQNTVTSSLLDSKQSMNEQNERGRDAYHQSNNTAQNIFTDQYDDELKRKERLRLEWQGELQQQMHDKHLRNNQLKQKNLQEDLADEERVHRQLRELKETFQNESKSKKDMQSEPGTPKSKRHRVAFNDQEDDRRTKTRGSVISRYEQHPPEQYI